MIGSTCLDFVCKLYAGSKKFFSTQIERYRQSRYEVITAWNQKAKEAENFKNIEDSKTNSNDIQILLKGYEKYLEYQQRRQRD
jgi:hypothetical protein